MWGYQLHSSKISGSPYQFFYSHPFFVAKLWDISNILPQTVQGWRHSLDLCKIWELLYTLIWWRSQWYLSSSLRRYITCCSVNSHYSVSCAYAFYLLPILHVLCLSQKQVRWLLHSVSMIHLQRRSDFSSGNELIC